MPSIPPDAAKRRASRAARVRRERLKIAMLMLATAALFAMTRAAAEQMHAATLHEAADWHRRGLDALHSGDVPAAVAALRRAALSDPDRRDYALSLAQALAADDQTAAAERVLLARRGAAPEDAQVNLQLARLAVRRGDATGAGQYFRSALYAPALDDDARRKVRLELIEFLLGRGDRERALAELVAARATVADDADAHIHLGTLLVRAGDPRLALDEFERALRLDARDDTALAGAGTAAFALGEYRTAVRYLSAASSLPSEAMDMREIAALVLSRDPLLPRLGIATRRARYFDAVRYVRERMAGCAAHAAPALPRGIHVDQDTIEDGLAVLGDAERIIAMQCGPLTAFDRALAIIVRRYDASP